LDIEARDRLIELDKKRQYVGRKSIACIALLDSGYNSEDSAMASYYVGDFLALGQEIKNNLTESRKPLYTNMAT